MSRVLRALAAAPAERCALSDNAGTLSYGELRRQIDSLVQRLPSVGAVRAAVLADNGRHWVSADLALLKRGAAHVPLPAYFSDAQIEHALRDAAIEYVLTDRAARVRAIDPDFTPLDSADQPLTLLRRTCAGSLPPHTAKITYTSGSTGTPRGVCLTQASIERVCDSLERSTRALELQRHLSLLPLPTLLENIAGVYVPLMAHGTLCLPALADTGVSYSGIDADRLLRCLDTHLPDSLVLVPELLRVLTAAAARGWKPARPLKFIAVGGARVSTEDLQRARELNLPVYEGYGLSECASVVCLNTPDATRIGSVGRVLPHARVRIDVRGELHVNGATMLGYLGHEPLRGDEVATGDLATIDADGYVHIRGRAKNLIITALGRNVSPEWVESELLQQPAIGQVMVVGEAQPYLGALIVSAANDDDIQRAVTAVNARLPDYARIQTWTRLSKPFSLHDGLLTANGRLRRGAIGVREALTIRQLFERFARCG